MGAEIRRTGAVGLVAFDDRPGQCWVGDFAWQTLERDLLRMLVCGHLGLDPEEWDPLEAIDSMKSEGQHAAFYHLAWVPGSEQIHARPAERWGQDTREP